MTMPGGSDGVLTVVELVLEATSVGSCIETFFEGVCGCPGWTLAACLAFGAADAVSDEGCWAYPMACSTRSPPFAFPLLAVMRTTADPGIDPQRMLLISTGPDISV